MQSEPRGFARPDLEHVAGAPAGRQTPRWKVVHDAHHLHLRVAEDDVERHAHEEHVDRLLAKGEALAGRKRAPAEKPARARAGTAREAKPIEQRPAVRSRDGMPGVHALTVVREPII